MNSTTPFTPQEVLSLNEIDYKNRGLQLVANCPLCGEKRSRLYVHSVSGKYTCFNCGEGGNGDDIVNLHAKLHNLSNKEAFRDIIKSLNCDGRDYAWKLSWEKEKKKELEKSPSLAAPKERNFTYRTLLSALCLSDADRKDFIRRGFDAEAILPYRTAVRNLPDALMEAIHQSGVPGCFTHYGKKRFSNNEGFYVPFVNHDNLICGMQVGLSEKARQRMKAENKKVPKYIWVSSMWTQGRDGYTGGCGTSCIHYACDFKNNQPILGKSVYITEGALKADVAYYLSKHPFIALPGVNNTRELKKELSYLKERGVETLVNAFDMDAFDNPDVQKASDKLGDLVKAHGFTYKRAIWDKKEKGVDDFLLSVKMKREFEESYPMAKTYVSITRVGCKGKYHIFPADKEREAREFSEEINKKGDKVAARRCHYLDGTLVELVDFS